MLAALVLTGGCDRKTEQIADDVVELVVWISYKGPEYEEFQELSAQFCRDYYQKTGKRVKITGNQTPFDDLVTYIRIACMAGKNPDIARVDALKVLELAYHQVLVELDQLENFGAGSIDEKSGEYLPAPFATNVVEVKTKEGKSETHLYGLPEQNTCLALFWNKELFAKRAKELSDAGLSPDRAPRDWEEFISYAKVLTYKEEKDGKATLYYGFAMKNSLWWTLPFFGCFGSRFVDTDAGGKKVCLLGDSRSCAALQLKVDLYQKYGVEAGAWMSGAVDPEVGFTNKKYAMILIGPWVVQKFRDRNLDFGVDLIPKITEKQAAGLGLETIPESATNVGGNDMVIFKTCRHPEIAYDFVNYLTSYEAQKKWCMDLKQIPVNRRAMEDLVQNESLDPVIRKFIEQSKYAIPPPPLPRYSFIEDEVVNLEMELALKKEKTVEQALKDAAAKIEKHVLSLLN